MRHDVFITGTDTGVGKSRASAALLHALARRGLRVVGMKPVAAGAEPDALGVLQNDDVLALRAASNVRVASALDNPICLPDAVSPHIAARNAGTRIDIGQIADRFKRLRAEADAVVVEGAGGFLVPLNDTQTGADLARALDLPVILVVGLRLGCLNHALLTRDAIRATGLPLAGWICNRLDPAMPEQQANLDYLRAQLVAPLLADWPFDPSARADELSIDVGHL
jgi:dethiobiotin synthetase